jgi:long-chain acyl-CoA synthetase
MTVTACWAIGELLDDLSARSQQPAIIAFGPGGGECWDCTRLAQSATGLANGLFERGWSGARAALCAPNSPDWIAIALGVLAAGAVLVPIDELADPAQFKAAIATSGARLVFTTARRLAGCSEFLAARDIRSFQVEDGAEPAAHWRSLASATPRLVPAPADDMPAMLSWTSGTTGSPKAFLLTHRNIATNVAALRELGVVGAGDRALLPLPLHHAYPFIVGMLSPLTLGAAVVLPEGIGGPQLTIALAAGKATVIIGVPRLYEALTAAIEARMRSHNLLLRTAWQAALRGAIFVWRSTGLHCGRILFAPVRHRVAPRLRLLVSGGARLETETEEKLEALGWTVLSGYGLAETASLFTGNRPYGRRVGSAGRPLADGQIRIADPDEQGVGEIELRGSSVTAGYLDNPEANRAAYASDGWFRTGDLGFVDRDGFLFVTGRAKELLVLGGGKKVLPEDLERVYRAAPGIGDLALLEQGGRLVALVWPDAAALRARGITNLHDGVRVILSEAAQGLPSYQRLAGFALTDRPLPRTRLGKYRRFLLPAIYAAASAGKAEHVTAAPSAEDSALLRDPTAAEVLRLLRQRYPGQPIDLDADLGLDLGVDSFGWLELSLLLGDRAGVVLSEAEIAAVARVRDLLRLAVERRAAPTVVASPDDIEGWLAPTGGLLAMLGALCFALNRLVMRCLFRLRVVGGERLPQHGPYLITPNHASDLDALAIAAALPLSRLRRVYWAGDRQRLFSNPFLRMFSRVTHVFPVDAERPGAVLAAAEQVLRGGNVQIWFPEGWRSPDGELQRFLPGVGELLSRSGVPAVPAFISGAFAALPRHRRFPRLRRISVTFGHPETVDALRAAGSGSSDAERIAAGLRRRVAALAPDRNAGAADGFAAVSLPRTPPDAG